MYTIKQRKPSVACLVSLDTYLSNAVFVTINFVCVVLILHCIVLVFGKLKNIGVDLQVIDACTSGKLSLKQPHDFFVVFDGAFLAVLDGASHVQDADNARVRVD
jgi:hypothetical protein